MAGVAAETLVYNRAEGGADDRTKQSRFDAVGFLPQLKAEGTLRLCKPTLCSKRIGLPTKLWSALCNNVPNC